jgi:hypothetical protein
MIDAVDFSETFMHFCQSTSHISLHKTIISVATTERSSNLTSSYSKDVRE